MNKIEIKEIQLYIIERIKNSDVNWSFTNSVWFIPSIGKFLYDDRLVNYEIIEPLIEQNKLIFKEYKIHQGEKMLRYILN